MTDFIDGLERDLIDAARRRGAAGERALRPMPRRPSLRTLLLTTLILSLTVGTAGAGTLLVLRGSAIPAPESRDVPPEQTPVPASAEVKPARGADPAGAAPWAIRVARSRAGFTCSTVGQVVDGRFGLVGLDGRFRTLANGLVDGCGQERKNAASLVGARVFDARRAADARTVVNGVAGDQLRTVTVDAAGNRRDVPVGAGGVFVTALQGYPEDVGVIVTLRFADGHVERHPFGTSEFVVPDPAGGRAWKVEAFSFGQSIPRRCVRPDARRLKACASDPNAPAEECARFRPARQVRNPPFSDGVCGRFANGRHRRGYFFGVRRQTPGRAFAPSNFLSGGWKDHPPRTAVFGTAGEDVAAIEVDGPGATKKLTIAVNRAFLAIYGPDVAPAQLTVRVTMRDGTSRTHSGDTHLITPRRQP